MFGKRKNNISQKPFISVILPTYNSERYVLDSLKSLLFQSYKNFEVIIIDDGSKDGTCKIIETFLSDSCKKDKRFRLFRCSHKGISASRNFGISRAKGEIITVLDSDDIFEKDALKNISSYFHSKKTDVLFGDIEVVDYDLKKIYVRKYDSFPNKEFINRIFWSFQVPFKHSSMSFRKDALLSIGKYNQNYFRLVDIELICRILFSNIRDESMNRPARYNINHINKVLVKYRQHSSSVSNSRFVQIKFWFKLIDEYYPTLFYNVPLKFFRFFSEVVKLSIHQVFYFFQMMRKSSRRS